jgi:uncharacterized repeat protein (TIGR04002 family)
MKNKKVLNLSLAAVFAALIFLATMIHISIGINGGYIHVGDTLVYLCAAFLPTPYAVSAAAVGGALADVASGAPLWVLPTVLIKALSALCFTSKKQTILCARNYTALFTGAFFCCGGYYIAEVLIYNCGFIIPLASVPMNLIQTGASAVLFIAIGVIFDRMGLKNRLSKL